MTTEVGTGLSAREGEGALLAIPDGSPGALSITAVRGWRLDALFDAADRMHSAAEALADEVAAVKRARDAALRDWRGAAADAATERFGRELRDGAALVDALHALRVALINGAVAIGNAKGELLTAIDAAIAAGFTVAEDGTVVPPGLPPVLSSPAGAAQAQAERQVQQSELECAAGGIGAGISRALRNVMQADQDLASALERVEVPASMHAQVEATLNRLGGDSGDAVAAVLAWGAGGFAAVQGAVKGVGTINRAVSFAQALRVAEMAEKASWARQFALGAADGGAARHVVGASNARLIGSAFLPLTFVSGGVDIFTGGGYDGARGAVTRGLGGAAVVGSTALMTYGSAALLASNPVGWTIAAGGVLIYSAWSLGNFAYDHHEQIADFAVTTAQWTGDAAQAVWDGHVEVVTEAADWAGKRLSGATEFAGDRLGEVANLGKKILSVPPLPF